MKCRKCKVKTVLIKSEWIDDSHGNCGDLETYQCPVCKKEKYVSKEDFYYPG